MKFMELGTGAEARTFEILRAKHTVFAVEVDNQTEERRQIGKPFHARTERQLAYWLARSLQA